MIEIQLPLTEDSVCGLRVGDPVLLNGIMLTGRDAVHKWLVDTFILKTRIPQGDDIEVYEAIKPLLKDSAIYHCGPVVATLENGDYRIVAAGPTTSTREEPYQAFVMRHFGVRCVIGKGGMGARTLEACREVSGIYVHAVGGAASLIAQSVTRVLGVYKLDFGMPEAMWVIEVKDFPGVVTMDGHGHSLHAHIEHNSKIILDELLSIE